MAGKHFGEDVTGLGPVKIEAAAFALGAPIYTVAVLFMAGGLERLIMLALYGLGAGARIAWRVGRTQAIHQKRRAG